MLTVTAMSLLLTQQALVPSPSPQPSETPTLEATETLTPTPTLSHLLIPGEVPRPRTSLYDTISGNTAVQGSPNQPPGGDDYIHNLYERPFNAETQDIFFPDLDIRHAEIGPGEPWMFVTIYLYGLRPISNTLEGAYLLELDLDIDGRGDWLFEARAPLSETWTVKGVRVWEDTNNDVGGDVPCYTDPPQVEDSYDRLVFNQGYDTDDPDAAWARLKPGTPTAVQIAFKYALIANDSQFMWGVWADQGVDQPQWYDYNDHFTYEEAGSPYPVNRYYPIKAIAEVDNTCRWTYGFEPDGDEPCLCVGGLATATPQPSPTPEEEPGGLAGWVYKDFNQNKERDAGDGGFGGATVIVRAGACPGVELVASPVTEAFGRYSVTGLAPGRYCVYAPDIGVVFAPPRQSVRVHAGSITDNVNFRYPP